jgi:hypothetical protein
MSIGKGPQGKFFSGKLWFELGKIAHPFSGSRGAEKFWKVIAFTSRYVMLFMTPKT